MDEKRLFKNICNLSNKEIARKYTFLGEGICREVYSISELLQRPPRHMYIA